MTINLSDCTLTPAYGRDYTNPDDAANDFWEGKDFRFNHYSGASAYCSIRDFKAEGLTRANIRFDAKKHLLILTWPKEES